MKHSFWCDECKRDFEAEGFAFGNTAGGTENRWYEGRCPKKHKAIRYITEKHLDPYFRKSEMLREMRMRFSKDLLQPGDPGFDKYYPEAKKKLEEDEEVFKQRNLKSKQDYVKMKRKYGHDPDRRNILNKVFEKEI